MYYEQYVFGETILDNFKIKQQKLRQATEDQKVTGFEIEKRKRTYSYFSRLCKVGDKKLSLFSIIDEINPIVIDNGKKIVVKWN